MNLKPHIEKAVSNVGGFVAASKITGAKSYQTVQQWVAAGQVPACYCVALERASGVSRLFLREDAEKIWPEIAETEIYLQTK